MNLDIKVEVRALDKLVDYVASGIGSIAGPILAPWKARQESRAMSIAADGDAKVLLIQAEAQSKAREILVSGDANQVDASDITTMVRQRIQYQERKRQANIESVVRQAANQLGDKEVANEEPDHDWTARFFNDVQDVSSNEMQSLWAKVLAGEVERAGSTSIRTLGILKNLHQSTARLFRKFCSACIFFIPDGKTFLDARVPSLGGNAAHNSLKRYELGFGALNRLNEHGLIISDYNSWYDYRLCVGQTIGEPPTLIRLPFRFQARNWILAPADGSHLGKELKMSGVALSNSGRELSSIVDLDSMDVFSQDLIGYFKRKQLLMTEVKN